ncbi:MAG: hypothetical protein CMN55_10515 [Sneathiella sp.]|jgi:hypothetical protein|uniref:DUF2933 domain-containing protein n=1 Tax=Sneathiella sp. TaxID=1964365 RepID=UPI000C683A59|nr:DUF2933 domain-containing protein [Sneathiella sp.]MAL79525.1 hypothetical protein [Sneathiella sp.]
MRDLFFSKTGIVLIGFIAVAGYFLWVEHTAHLVTYLPLILLLGGCVLMHVFMHHGHGGHGSDNDSQHDSSSHSDKKHD